MPAKRKPVKYAINGCTGLCSLNRQNLAPTAFESIHSWYEEGANNEEIVARAAKLVPPVKIGTTTAWRHRHNHLQVVTGELPEAVPEGPRKSNLQILEQLIARGATQLDLTSTRVSPEQLLKAMELHQRMTQGSIWGDLLSSLAEDDAPVDFGDDPAKASADEKAQDQIPDG